MSGLSPRANVFIGWDVGGWDCDRNPNSRDALVILDDARRLLGCPWRGNLRETINAAQDSDAWLSALFAHCRAPRPRNCTAVLAIDAPLAFSREFGALLQGRSVAAVPGSDRNPYLYRHTERYLIARGHRPLSPLKDMLGSQTTKVMHALARFAPDIQHTGVWQGEGLEVIEAYPSVAKKSPHLHALQAAYTPSDAFAFQDQIDALLCALVGWLFVHDARRLIAPTVQAPDQAPREEGWIWVPEDALTAPAP